jgi:hypothetical protein
MKVGERKTERNNENKTEAGEKKDMPAGFEPSYAKL